jgi:large subunit ribosomal protein L25
MADYSLKAEPRTVTGKQVRQLRREGLTPVTVYGRDHAAASLQVPTRELVHVLAHAGSSQLIDLHVDGEKRPRVTLAREVQLHVTRHTPLHVDFIQVTMNQPVTAQVPVVLADEPELVSRGDAVVQHFLPTVQVEALPADLPAAVPIDPAALDSLDAVVTVADLDLGAKVRILHDPEDRVIGLGAIKRRAAEALEEELAAEAVIEAEEEAGAGGEE